MPMDFHARGYDISYHVLHARLMGGHGTAREDLYGFTQTPTLPPSIKLRLSKHTLSPF